MGRNIATLALVCLLAAGGLWWWHTHRAGTRWRPALRAREIATRVLAEHLAAQYPKTKLLVIGNPFVLRKAQASEIYAFEDASLRGLEEGASSQKPIKVVYPALRPDYETAFVDPKTTTPLSYLVADDAFDALVEANSNCEVVVSLVGLPVNIREERLWRESEKPHLGLLLPDWRVLGSREAVREALQSEKISAAVLERPHGNNEAELPRGDYHAEFNRRFLLVTKTNVDELIGRFPQLF